MSQPIRSELGWSASDRVVVRGYDEAQEHIGLGDLDFLELTARVLGVANPRGAI